MIGDKHIISNTSRSVGIGLMATEIEELIYDLRWLIALSFALIIADFWLGISESKMVGKDIRRSKAWRRTLNKVVDYMCYLMVAGLLGKAIGEPMGMNALRVASVVMLLTCAWELDSIYGHICVLNGAEKDFSIRKSIFGIFKRKLEDKVDSLNKSVYGEDWKERLDKEEQEGKEG